MPQTFWFLLAQGWEWGEGILLSEDWQSPRISLSVCVGEGTKGQAESRSSVVFSRNQKPSFPLQANLEKKCPT